MKDTMDHSEVRELLEDAAIEPGGLERLMAGDTPTASIVAGHLAGCADCAEGLERLRRSVRLIRPEVQLVPPPELKERTLANVAALGRPRSAADAADAANDRGVSINWRRLDRMASAATIFVVLASPRIPPSTPALCKHNSAACQHGVD
jgi:hypothetical protein